MEFHCGTGRDIIFACPLGAAAITGCGVDGQRWIPSLLFVLQFGLLAGLPRLIGLEDVRDANAIDAALSVDYATAACLVWSWAAETAVVDAFMATGQEVGREAFAGCCFRRPKLRTSRSSFTDPTDGGSVVARECVYCPVGQSPECGTC